MKVLASNNCRRQLHTLAKKYPGILGHLYSPNGFRGPFPHLPYALDNGVFGAWSSGQKWDAAAFLAHLDRAGASQQAPLWVVVPDAVGDRQTTIAKWKEWAGWIRRLYRWPLAFAVQDDMTPVDVPDDADLVFVGGTTRWKWATVTMWCSMFPRVHVGRVNAEYRLWQLYRLGAESCDGSGWFRAGGGDRLPRSRSAQYRGLVNYVQRIGEGLGPCPKIETRNLFGELAYIGGRR